LEKVQKRATKILPLLKNLRESERLKIYNTPTLHYRGIRGYVWILSIKSSFIHSNIQDSDWKISVMCCAYAVVRM